MRWELSTSNLKVLVNAEALVGLASLPEQRKPLRILGGMLASTPKRWSSPLKCVGTKLLLILFFFLNFVLKKIFTFENLQTPEQSQFFSVGVTTVGTVKTL